jgi:hypothetical protein
MVLPGRVADSEACVPIACELGHRPYTAPRSLEERAPGRASARTLGVTHKPRSDLGSSLKASALSPKG